MTGADLSELLHGIPEKTLSDWRSRGIGPAFVKIGRHVRYRPTDVEKWLASRTTTTHPA